VLLSRRLIEAGVSLVQVNWYRGPNEPSDNPCWDSHTDEPNRLRNVLVPPMDQAFAALLDDLSQRGRLEDTLVVCMAEFGRTPRYNGRAGRDHWGSVFSVALAGAGIRGGMVHGVSDRSGAQPRDGRVRPEDLTATILHCLGHQPDTEMRDALNRPIPLSRGKIVRQVLA
jgi:arylsulfatase A-like enzyme